MNEEMTAQLCLSQEDEPPRLAEQHPDEIAFFAKKFVWSSNRGGFYSRTAYLPGQNRHPWRPSKRRNGRWQHFYPDLVTDLIEKHLDFARFIQVSDYKSQVRVRDDETAFWLGTMAGERTWADCIDVDSHDVVGWYGVPTRWHPSINPWSSPVVDSMWRYLPVVRLSLDHFQKLKLFYDAFPARIWAFSSVNLGLGLWRMHQFGRPTAEVHRAVGEQLRRIDRLGMVEHYPWPSRSRDTMGKCHRRPCGMDSGIITEDGIVTDPIEQIRLFMNPHPTPSFGAICQAILRKLDEAYDAWLDWDDLPDPNPKSAIPRTEQVAELLAELVQVKDWLASGCPAPAKKAEPVQNVDFSESAVAQNVEISGSALPDESTKVIFQSCDSTIEEELQPDHPLKHLFGQYPESFFDADLVNINASGHWVEFCVFLATYGFPGHDTFLPVISTLTRWLVFVEGLTNSETKELLEQYCLLKHNGFITRLNNGNSRLLLDHVDRLVDSTIASLTTKGRNVLRDIASKRASGCYGNVIYLAPLLSSSNIYSSFLCPISCGGLRNEHQASDLDWVYVPDNTPLPSAIIEAVRKAFDEAGIKLRRRDGEYPTLQAITRFINYLYAGQPKGQRRASQQLLNQMGLPTKSAERQRLKKVLVKARILIEGGYLAKSHSRLYMLPDDVVDVLESNREPRLPDERQRA